LGTVTFGEFSVEIVDSVDDYVILMKEIFDFEAIKTFFKENPSYKVLMDSMHGGMKRGMMSPDPRLMMQQ
jgi:phosphoglucomutase